MRLALIVIALAMPLACSNPTSGEERTAKKIEELEVRVGALEDERPQVFYVSPNYKSEARDALAKAELHSAVTAMERRFLEAGDTYAGVTVDELKRLGFEPSSSIDLSIVHADDEGFRLRAKHAQHGPAQGWEYNSQTEKMERATLEVADTKPMAFDECLAFQKKTIDAYGVSDEKVLRVHADESVNTQRLCVPTGGSVVISCDKSAGTMAMTISSLAGEVGCPK